MKKIVAIAMVFTLLLGTAQVCCMHVDAKLIDYTFESTVVRDNGKREVACKSEIAAKKKCNLKIKYNVYVKKNGKWKIASYVKPKSKSKSVKNQKTLKYSKTFEGFKKGETYKTKIKMTAKKKGYKTETKRYSSKVFKFKK